MIPSATPLEQPADAAASSDAHLHPTLLRIVVCFAGLTTMGVEMSASRLLAPYFGTSLYVWAVLIGLIMVYLTVGYYLGGRLADRFPQGVVLYRITLGAGLCVTLVPLVAHPILQWSVLGFDQLSVGIFIGSLVGVIALFAAPVIALGCVAPFAVRLSVREVQGAGNAAGSMYALSTVGSLVGTFGAVFVGIPTIGTRRTLVCLGLALMLVSLPGLLRRAPLYLLAVLPAVAQLMFPAIGVRAAQDGRLLYETESAYYYIQVVQNGPQRELVLDEGHAVHSVYNPHRLLTGEYWDSFLLAPMFVSHYRPAAVRNVAILGLGGGTVARLIASVYPGAQMQAAEIDPAVVSVARRYFGLHERRLTVWTQDARYFIATHTRRYDLVTIDAFRQPYIPFQLTTRDFFALLKTRLTPHAVVAINVGHTSTDFRLVNAVAHTMRTVFPSVAVLDVPGTINSIVVAANAPVGLAAFRHNMAEAAGPARTVAQRALRAGHIRPAPTNGTVFTDDLAPVEQLIDQIILDYARNGGQ